MRALFVMTGKRLVTMAVLILMILLTISAGCAPVQRGDAPPPPSTVAAAPTGPPPVAPTGALLVLNLDYYNWHSPPVFTGSGPPRIRYVLQPADPATGEKDTGYEPLDMGRYLFPFLAASPDGRMLAALTTVDPADLGFPAYNYRKLRLFRLDTWDEIRGPDIQPSWIGHLLWNPSGTRLYMFGSGGAGGVSHLWIIDLQGAEPRLQAEVEIPFVVESARTSIAPDGNTLYIFGYLTDDSGGDNITSGPPFLVAIDAATGRERARLELPEVKIGLYPSGRPALRADIIGTSYNPGLAMSPDGDRYYIAHADENAITVVNLETMAVERTVNPTTEASLRERLRALLEKPARAKGGLTHSASKDLLVSRDGRWLYLLGESTRVVPVGKESFSLETKATGVRVIDTETMKEVAHLAAGDTEKITRRVAPSPDGRHLYVTGLEYRPAGSDGGQDVTVGLGLMVYETGTWKLVSRLAPGADYRVPVPGADGRFVYLFDSVRPEGAAENETRTRLTVVATGDWTVRSERVMEEHPYCIMAGPGRCRE